MWKRRYVENRLRGPSICLKRVSEGKNREASGEEISKEIMAENISELKKENTHYGAEQDIKTKQYLSTHWSETLEHQR